MGHRFLLRASFCDTNLFLNKEEAENNVGLSTCPHRDICKQEGYMEKHDCVMATAIRLARLTIMHHTEIEEEIEAFFIKNPKGSHISTQWIYSEDREEFVENMDLDQAVGKVREVGKFLLSRYAQKDELKCAHCLEGICPCNNKELVETGDISLVL